MISRSPAVAEPLDGSAARRAPRAELRLETHGFPPVADERETSRKTRKIRDLAHKGQRSGCEQRFHHLWSWKLPCRDRLDGAQSSPRRSPAEGLRHARQSNRFRSLRSPSLIVGCWPASRAAVRGLHFVSGCAGPFPPSPYAGGLDCHQPILAGVSTKGDEDDHFSCNPHFGPSDRREHVSRTC